MSYEVVKRNIVDELQCLSPHRGQRVDFNPSTSSPSSTFLTKTTQILVFAAKDCWVRIGEDPTAEKLSSTGTTLSHPCQGGFWHPFTVLERNQKVAVIGQSDSSYIVITEGR